MNKEKIMLALTGIGVIAGLVLLFPKTDELTKKGGLGSEQGLPGLQTGGAEPQIINIDFPSVPENLFSIPTPTPTPTPSKKELTQLETEKLIEHQKAFETGKGFYAEKPKTIQEFFSKSGTYITPLGEIEILKSQQKEFEKGKGFYSKKGISPSKSLRIPIISNLTRTTSPGYMRPITSSESKKSYSAPGAYGTGAMSDLQRRINIYGGEQNIPPSKIPW